MSQRMTSIGPRSYVRDASPDDLPFPLGFEAYGLKTRVEMLKRYREHYERQMAEARFALSLGDDDLVVHTYSGTWARRGEREVTS